MSVLDCIAGKVAAGELSPQQGEAAKRVHEGIIGDLYMRLPAADAEAVAALETARILEEGAKARRMALARDAIGYAKGLERIEQRPDNPIAGLMSLSARDIRERGGINVESVAKDYEGRFAGAVNAKLDAYRSTAAGFRQDKAGIRQMVYEIFGVDTRNVAAREASEAWREFDRLATDAARKLGKVFTPADDWRLPQWWESSRLRQLGRRTFIGDVEAAIESGGLRIYDPETGQAANALRARIILDAAADRIMADSSAGAAGGAFRSEMRTFRFTEGQAGADAYLKLMDKYGAGQGGYLNMMEVHVQKVSRELASMHVLGPSYRANGEALLAAAKEMQATRPAPTGGVLAAIGRAVLAPFEGPVAAERLVKYATGQLSGAESELLAGVMAGARAFVVTTTGGSMVISGMAGDSVSLLMAAQHIGIEPGRIVARLVEGLAGASREEAARMGIVAHAAMDSAIGTKRFGDQVVGEKLMARLAEAVIRAQGLNVWDTAVKRAFTMEFLGALAQRSGQSWEALDAPFRQFLERYRFTAEEWAVLARPEHHMPVGEARFLMPDSLPDEALRVKLMSALYDERQFASLADASIRQKALATGGTKAGTGAGELWRSAFLYRTFSMTMLATWGMRAATQGSTADKLFMTAQLGLFLTMAGAVSVQARQTLQGRDPKPMTSPGFWAEAAFAGGAMNIYGDFINQAFSRSGSSLTETMLGPLAVFPNALGRLTSGARRHAEEGAHVNFGGALADFARKFTPGTNLWYSRLITDRYLFDNIRRLLDPDYPKAFLRQKERARKDGQGLWWAPGETRPRRAPTLANVAGR